MTKNPEPLKYNQMYYIMASALEQHSLFIEELNYPYFLNSVKKYIKPFAEIIAYSLLPNQVHLVIFVNKKESLLFLDELWANPERIAIFPSRQFSNLFNSYSQAMAKRFNRKGGLFKRPFYRKKILTAGQLQNCLTQIYKLPASIGYESDWSIYPWTSLKSFASNELSNSDDLIEGEAVLEWSGLKDLIEKFTKSGIPVF